MHTNNLRTSRIIFLDYLRVFAFLSVLIETPMNILGKKISKHLIDKESI